MNLKTAAGKCLTASRRRVSKRCTSASSARRPASPPRTVRRYCLTAAAAAAVLVMGLLVTEYRTRRADTPAPDLEQMLATTPAETLRQAAAENYDDILYNQQL